MVKGEMTSPRIILRPKSGISPEQSRDARVRAWGFVLDCWQKKVKETSSRGEEGSKSSHETKGGRNVT